MRQGTSSARAGPWRGGPARGTVEPGVPVTERLRRHPLLTGLFAVILVLTAVWISRLVGVARSVSANADYWVQPRGETGGLLYVAFGDSAAQGIGASEPDKSYVGLIAQRLRDSTGRPVKVANLSKSGARIRDVLDVQLPALDTMARAPDLVTVAIGGNDIRAYDRATFAAETERFTTGLPSGAYIADAPYFMHGRWQQDAAHSAPPASQRRRAGPAAGGPPRRAQGPGLDGHEHPVRRRLVPPQRPRPPGLGRRVLARDRERRHAQRPAPAQIGRC